MEPPTTRVLFFDLGDTLVRTADRSWLPGARELLASARGAGLKLGVISNTDDLDRDELAGLLPPDFDWQAFDPGLVILSSEVGFKKPSPEIFRKATDASGEPPSACLFCTEDLVDTLAAQRAGLVAARLQAPPRAELGLLLAAVARAGLTPAAGGG